MSDAVPLSLAVLTFLLALVAPRVLVRIRALRKTPLPAIWLWQSVVTAAVVSAVATGVTLAIALSLPSRVTLRDVVVTDIALALVALIVGRLLSSGHNLGTLLRRLRRRQRWRVDVIGRHDDGGPDPIRVLEHATPAVYCLPAVRGARIVVTEGALDRLTDQERASVLAHEHAHLRARHDLVLEGFSVVNDAFPMWVCRRALAEVRLLAEVLADRAAVRDHGSRVVGSALLVVAGGLTPPGGLGAGDFGLTERLRLLQEDRPHRLQSAIVAAGACAVALSPLLVGVAVRFTGA